MSDKLINILIVIFIFIYCNILSTASSYFYFQYKKAEAELQASQTYVEIIQRRIDQIDLSNVEGFINKSNWRGNNGMFGK